MNGDTNRVSWDPFDMVPKSVTPITYWSSFLEKPFKSPSKCIFQGIEPHRLFH